MGLAAGDALGTTLEFARPGTFSPLTDIVGGGPFDLEPGQWTDDTSMALCLADSLIAKNSFDPIDQLTRYWDWYHTGYLSSTGTCFDIGSTTALALITFHKNGEPFPGSTNPNTAGNGSLMRLAPIPMAYGRAPHHALNLCVQSSRTTHGAQTALDACRYFGGLLIGALNGIGKVTLLSAGYRPVVEKGDAPFTSEIDEIANGSFKTRQPPQIVAGGYVVKTLEAALWAFYHTENFHDGALMAVNLGNDSDTVGAIYGQIGGAYYGLSGIPTGWIEKLTMRGYIETQAKKLLDLSETAAFGEVPRM